jgi:hypothetical protein
MGSSTSSTTKPNARCGGKQLNPDKAGIAEKAQIQQWAWMAPLDKHESGKQQGRATQRGDRHGVQPTLRGRLQDGKGEQCQRGSDGQCARHIELLRSGVARFTQYAHADGESNGGCGDDQHENGLPAKGRGQPACGHRAQCQSGTKAGAEQAESAHTRLPLHLLRQSGCTGRQHPGTGDTLERAQSIKHPQVGRCHQCQRGGHEHGDGPRNTLRRPCLSARAPAAIRQLPNASMKALVTQASASGEPPDGPRFPAGRPPGL